MQLQRITAQPEPDPEEAEKTDQGEQPASGRLPQPASFQRHIQTEAEWRRHQVSPG